MVLKGKEPLSYPEKINLGKYDRVISNINAFNV